MLDGWAQPPSPPVCDLSNLTQQIISVIVQTGGLRPDELYRQLCGEGAFRDVERRLFVALLRRLVRCHRAGGSGRSHSWSQRGGPEERQGLLRSFRDAWGIRRPAPQRDHRHDSNCVRKGRASALGGRRWLIVDVDHERLEVHVLPARDYKRPKFGGVPWTGSRIQQTLQAAFAVKGIAAHDELIGLAASLRGPALGRCFRSVTERAETGGTGWVPMRIRRKYDWLFDDELLDVSIARGALDVDGAGIVLRSIKRPL